MAIEKYQLRLVKAVDRSVHGASVIPRVKVLIWNVKAGGDLGK
jgi:hypothetical protein